MVGIDVIYKSLTDVISKCSNHEIQTKLASMSQEEKNERLEGKMNPFEKTDYKGLLDDFEMWSMIDEDTNHNDPTAKEELDKLRKQIFDYEKRIYRGYKLENGSVPVYNIDDFQNTPHDIGDDRIGEIESAQIKHQSENTNLTGSEVSCLIDYFSNGSSNINCDLDHNYHNQRWKQLTNEEQNSIHESNEEKIMHIDNAMNKTDGLITDTILYHGVNDSNIVTIHTRVGDKVNIKSYISTSFHEKVGKGYGQILNNNYKNGKPIRLYVRFLAPKGTKGFSANDSSNGDLTGFLTEHEYLLARGQSGTVVDIDYDNGEITVLLD